MVGRPKLLELRPDRLLLNSDFDGYKLSLAQVPTITEQLKVSVDRLAPDINQYSLLHAKLFALHNHLLGESDDSESVYFVDKDLNIQKLFIDAEEDCFRNVTLWKIPLQRERSNGDYNISLKFATPQIAVAADGMGYLYVLDRGSESDKWNVIFSGDVAGPDQNFIISSVVYKESDKPELHLLLLSIRQNKDANERNCTILHWITLMKTDSWNQVALRELTVQGFVQYAHLEQSCEAVYVVSDTGCKFTLDSEKEISKTNEETVPEKKYTWKQSREDVTVKFPLPPEATRGSVQINTENSKIQIKNQEEVLLEGALYQRIDSDLTCWTFDDNTLEITLQKLEPGLMWPELVQGDMFGEHIPEPGLVEEIAERLAPLTSENEVAPPSGATFNSQQIEECDFECDKLTIFERINCDSHDVTHRVNFGSHQVLLTVQPDKNLPPALAVRYDVDTCIWQPKIESGNFQMEHKGTLLALGYIQASKQQMKFFVCSPDMSYSVICESSKHIFIYFQRKSIASSELRNRTTGRRVNTLAQQQVYNLSSNDEILGIYASNSYLYVLGETFLTAFKM